MLRCALFPLGAAVVGCGGAPPIPEAPTAAGSPATRGAGDQPRRVALIVGIDAYGPSAAPTVAAAEQWTPLQGAKRDARSLAVELERRGFEVTTVLDADATRAGITRALEALAAKVVPGRGDVALFHFSGHGQQVPDHDGPRDEPDGYDEAIIPYDNRGVRDYTAHLTDDELGALVSRLTDAADHVVISLDSCHSGTATRALTTRGRPPAHPPSPVSGARAPETSWLAERAPRASLVVMSAARSDQLAGELRVPHTPHVMGAYTYYLVRALAAAGPATTYRGLIDRVAAQLRAAHPGQDPVIEGAQDTRLFSAAEATGPRGFRALPPREPGRVPIEGGVVHGLAVGALLALVPHDAEADGANVIAEVTLASVDVGASVGVPTAGFRDVDLTTELESGAVAVELTRRRVPDPLYVHDAVGSALTRRVLAAPGPIEPCQAPLPWDIELTADAHGDVVLRRSDGGQVGGPIATSAGAEDRLIARLMAEHRRSRLARLVNASGASHLPVQLWIETGAPSRPATVADGDTVAVGASLRLGFDNRHDHEIFVHVFSLDADGEVALLFPSTREANDRRHALAPGESRLSGVAFRAAPPLGEQLLKLIATETPVDLSMLSQPASARAGGWRAAPLPMRVLSAMSGGSSDRAVPFGPASVARWGTDAVRFTVVSADPATETTTQEGQRQRGGEVP